MVNKILSVVRTIGILISVITLAVIGIKYMVGSVEEKAEYKKTMIPYLIGVFLIFSFTTFPQLIYNIVTSME
jgi:type IV secretory pathway VirB2 component (pilin)